MNKQTFYLLEDYMLSCMNDSAHDKEHIYRVLYHALEIADAEANVDYDVLIAACLLHDIGRKEQFENPNLCHAQVGSEKAYQFLLSHGFEDSFAEQVMHCIQTHRFRKNQLPQTIEAKILFDADKLDVTGAMGIARSLIYKGNVAEPLYNLSPDGTVSNGESDTSPSFLHEYKFKLEKLYTRFYTAKAAEMANHRQAAAAGFYNALLEEASSAYQNGKHQLNKLIK